MPVFGYLAYPVDGEKETLLGDLAALDHCDVMPAENQDVLVLVTDTPDDSREQDLQKQLKKLRSLQSLSMTFGHSDDNPPPKP